MFNFFKPKIAEGINQELITYATKLAFEFFKDEKQRELLNFEKLSQSEQDRIFNELVMTAILAIVFAFESRILHDEYLPDSLSVREKLSFLKTTKEQVFNNFLDWHFNLGTKKKFVDLFRKCLEMRYSEYEDDRKRLIRELPKEDIFDDAENNELAHWELCSIQSLIVGSLFHVKRGKTSPEDPYTRPYKTWLMVLYGNLKKRINKI